MSGGDEGGDRQPGDGALFPDGESAEADEFAEGLGVALDVVILKKAVETLKM